MRITYFPFRDDESVEIIADVDLNTGFVDVKMITVFPEIQREFSLCMDSLRQDLIEEALKQRDAEAWAQGERQRDFMMDRKAEGWE